VESFGQGHGDDEPSGLAELCQRVKVTIQLYHSGVSFRSWLTPSFPIAVPDDFSKE
jgi:hypothetical protein